MVEKHGTEAEKTAMRQERQSTSSVQRYIVARIAGSHLGTDPEMMGLVNDMLAPGTTLIDGYVFDIDDEPEFQVMVYEAGIVTVLIGPLEET